jgi:hypothetical protein
MMIQKISVFCVEIILLRVSRLVQLWMESLLNDRLEDYQESDDAISHVGSKLWIFSWPLFNLLKPSGNFTYHQV